MFTGIGQEKYLGRILSSMSALQRNWRSSLEHQRIHLILQPITDALGAEGVPLPKTRLRPDCEMSTSNAEFDAFDWVLNINKHLVRNCFDDVSDMIAELGGALMHESRHCEQFWRIAQFVLAQTTARGLTPALGPLQNKLPGFAEDVLKKAVSQKIWLKPVTPKEKREAESWYESIYGRGKSFGDFNDVLPQLSSVKGRFADVGQSYQISAFSRYQRGQAYEEDAWTLGLEVRTRYLASRRILPRNCFLRPRAIGGVSSF